MKNHLHLGVVRGGKLIDDRYIPEKGTLLVGSSSQVEHRLAGPNVPERHPLFNFHNHHPVLHVTGGMAGEVALDGKTRQSLSDLKAKGRPAPEGWEIELPDTARGWVSLGDAAFYFTVGPKPPPPPRKNMEAGLAINPLAGIEKTFAAALVVILVIELGAFLVLKSRPLPDIDEPDQEDLDRFAEVLMPEKPKLEEKKVEDKPAAEEAPAEKAEKKADKKQKEEEAVEDSGAKSKDNAPASDEARRAEVAAKVRNTGLLAILGSRGDGSSGGAFADVLGSRNLAASLGDAVQGGLDAVGAGMDVGARKATGAGTGGAATIGEVGAGVGGGGGSRNVDLGDAKPKVAPQVSFDNAAIEVDAAPGSGVDKAKVVQFVKARQTAVKGCYEKEIKLNPSLKGRVVMRWVINTDGRVSEVEVDENTTGSDAVASCIRNMIRGWKFPFAPEEEAPVSFPFIFVPGG